MVKLDRIPVEDIKEEFLPIQSNFFKLTNTNRFDPENIETDKILGRENLFYKCKKISRINK